MKAKVFFLALAVIALAFPRLARADVQVGEIAPDFTLTDIEGKKQTLVGQQGNYVVLEWTNPDCPFVHKQYDSGTMQALQKEMTSKGVVWFSIASSAPGKQGHYSAKEWKQIVTDRKAFPTAVLLDPKGLVGKQYGAKTTPHMYVIDPKGVLIYEGAIDSIPSADPADIKEATNYVSQALNEAMSGQPVSTPSTKSYGCSIKYAS
ncbi:MAG TPA: redoxin domain-containing protein [Verrucomicrobiae bacterium]|nr:redoxin domain-containing protein [Verrucomicrobiae bacterium]